MKFSLVLVIECDGPVSVSGSLSFGTGGDTVMSTIDFWAPNVACFGNDAGSYSVAGL